ncbi:hypothetical protein [Rossellomorea marisflavi]
MKKLAKRVLVKTGLIEKKQPKTTTKQKEPFQRLGGNWNSEQHPVAFMFGFNPWKREHMSHFFTEYRTAYVFGNGDLNRLEAYFNKYEEKVFIIWGFKEEPDIVKYAKENSITLYRVEDGFVRSVGLGAAHTLPLSIAVDSKTLYFDSREASDLEEIIKTYDFSKKPSLIPTARKTMNMLINMGVSKYNHAARTDINEVYGEKKKKRILVIGQVEDDASIKYGCSREIKNNDLVWAAYNENPDAEIIYKPHPDVLGGYRKAYSNPMDVAHISKVVTEPLGLVDALETIDHVYTITSLAGFEALIRGIKVTCFGAPFYSGWGLTDDRQETTRRTRKVTIEELFAAAYIIYPRYVDPETNQRIELEEAINVLAEMITKNTFLKGKEQFGTGDVETAVASMQKAINDTTSTSSKSKWSLEVIKLQLDNKDFEEVVRLTEEFQIKFPQKITDQVYYYRGKAYESLGEYEKALFDLNAALMMDRKLTTLETLINLLWKVNGPNAKTIELLEEALGHKKQLKEEQLITYAAILNQAGEYQWAKSVLPEKTEVPYMALKGLVEKRKEDVISNIMTTRDVNNKLILSEGDFETAIEEAHGDFCLVGEDSIESHQADFIDNHSLVIRINEVDQSYPNILYKGKKTDVWFGQAKRTANLGRIYKKASLTLISDVNFSHANPNAEETLRHLYDLNQTVQSYPDAFYRELIQRIKKEPSEALLLLYWIYKIQGPIEPSKIVGIDVEKLSIEEKTLINEVVKNNTQKYV